MKFTTILVGAFAAVASAKSFDMSQLNNLQKYNSKNIQYLNNVNDLNLNLLAELGSVNNFNILSFSELFQTESFDLQSVLQLGQLQMLIQLADLGLFNGYDLSELTLDALSLGLVENVGSEDLGQFISSSVQSQVETVAAEVVVISKD